MNHTIECNQSGITGCTCNLSTNPQKIDLAGNIRRRIAILNAHLYTPPEGRSAFVDEEDTIKERDMLQNILTP